MCLNLCRELMQRTVVPRSFGRSPDRSTSDEGHAGMPVRRCHVLIVQCSPIANRVSRSRWIIRSKRGASQEGRVRADGRSHRRKRKQPTLTLFLLALSVSLPIFCSCGCFVVGVFLCFVDVFLFLLSCACSCPHSIFCCGS